MGADLIIVVFAVVVIGGMGSIMGSIITGFGLGVIEGLTKVFYPEASNTVIFVIMAIVLLIRPAGLFGSAEVGRHDWQRSSDCRLHAPTGATRHQLIAFLVMAALFVVAPAVVYPVFLMKALCFALFACAFNLLIGYVGLLSFGHAMFFGIAGYVDRAPAKVWGLHAGAGDPVGTAGRRVLGVRGRPARHPPPGHLLRDDHAGAGADGVLLLPAGAVHRRRGRHPGRAARQAVRRLSTCDTTWRCTTSCWRSSSAASC